MPFYDYDCSEGHRFERRAKHEDDMQHCECGALGKRAPFSGRQNISISGKEALPTDPTEIQNMEFDILRERGWSGDRAYTEMRANVKEDDQGRKFLDTSKLTQTA